MLKIYRRPPGKNWHVKYPLYGKVVRETTGTHLFCAAWRQARYVQNQLARDVEKAHLSEKGELAWLFVNSIRKSREQETADGFDSFYLKSTDTPYCCDSGMGSVYAALANGIVKVGVTVSPRQRFGAIERSSGFCLQLIYVSKQCKNYKEVEQAIHSEFHRCRKVGEWFDAPFERVVDSIHRMVGQKRLNNQQVTDFYQQK